LTSFCSTQTLDQFKSLIITSPSLAANVDISILTPSSFDPRNQYATVFQAVRAAAATDSSKGEAETKIYKVHMGGTRLEYWVLALDARGGRIVGLKAKAVES
jgi:hypothetical protein